MYVSTAARRPHGRAAGLIASLAVVLWIVLAATAAARPIDAPSAQPMRLPACTIFGTPGQDILRGTRGHDVICAVAGNDRVYGGRGDDVIFGSNGDDRLYGGPGNDRIYGFRGRDHLSGGSGDDFLQPAAGPDVVSGGPGTDTVDYRLRHARLRVSLGHGADDGARGEHDNVHADVENVNGGHAGDVLVGDGRRNVIFGGGGNDVLRGLAGADRLLCGAGGKDLVFADASDHVAASCERVRRSGGPQPKPPARNHAPSAISLSGDRVAENQPAGTAVGTLSATDRDRGQHHRFTLVAGPGSADNGSFAIDGSTLRTAASFDFEAKSTYSIRVRARDDGHPARSLRKALTITVTNVDEAPTGLSLSPDTVAENEPAGTAVGTLSATDPDAGDRQTFSLASGPGSDDNGSFAVDGSTLRTTKTFDFETKRSYSVRLRATDRGGLTVERSFTVTVIDTIEPPTADAKTVTGVTEDGSKAIELSGGEPQGASLGFTVVSGPQHGALDTHAPTATCNGAKPSHCTASVVYTPDANFNGADSFTYRVDAGSRQSAPVTVSITVDPVNDRPTATDGTATLDEDGSAAVDLGALVSDVETSDADLTYHVVSGPAHGQLNGTGPTPTYKPDGDFNGTDTFSYEVTDRGDPDNCSGTPCDAPRTSTTQTVSITVNPVNDAPDAGTPSLHLDEDGSPTSIDLRALASDQETARADLSFHITGGPTHGTITGTDDAPTYTPDANFNGADSFTYTITDRGDPDNCTAAPCDGPKTTTTTVPITVDAVDDPPVNTVPAGPITALQDTNTPITGASISDIDAGSDDVQLTLSAVHGTLTVSTSVLGGVTPLQVTGNGTGTAVVTASLTAINATLADANGLVYHGDAAFTGPDTLTFATDDLGHNGSGGPLTDTDTVALNVVPPNHAPVASGQSVTTDEDTAKTITLSASDADGDDPLTFAIASPPATGSLGSIGPVTCDHATPNTCTADVTYTPDSDANGHDSFTFTASDGQADSAPATVGIDVTAVNDAPSVSTSPGTTSYTENDPATVVDSGVTVVDVDSTQLQGATVTITNAVAGDQLQFADQHGITASGSGTPTLHLTGNATLADYATALSSITYRSTSDDPTNAQRTVRFVVTDAEGADSAPADRGIDVTPVNDAPSLAGIESGSVDYVESVDSPPSTSQLTNALTVADPDDASLSSATVQITNACHSGEDVLTFTNQSGITGTYNASTCTLTLTGSSTVANYQAALRSIKYENTSDTPDTSTRTVSFQVDDGHAANHASNTQTRDLTVTAANDSPVGGADTFNGSNSALAGVTLAVSTSPSTPNVSVSGNLLANDSDPDSPHADLTATAGTASANGGVVDVHADGSFSYTPAPGFTGSDTFTYTVHDHGSPDRTGTGTVTINVAGPRVWFVDPGGAGGGNGTSAAPLNSLAPLSSGGTSDSLDGNGDVIFVYQGTGNAASGGFTLEGNQRLVGQPQGLSVTNGNGSYNLVNAGGTNPTITNGSGNGLTLADGNTVQRIDVTGSSGVGVSGSGVNTLTYGANTTISGNSGGGFALSGAAGGAVSVGADISTSAGHSVSIANRTGGTTDLTGSVNDTGAGVSLTSNTGATINLKGPVTASTGTNPAFTATGGGTVTVTGAPSTLTTTSATALNVAGTNIGAAGLSFRSITSNGGSSTGIILDTTGSSGGLTVTGNGTPGSGGTIANKSGADASTTTGVGIYLNNTQSPSFARMQLNDFQNFAIRGTGVRGLTLADSTINGSNGTSTAADEASVAIDNLTGSGSITNDTITGGVEDDVRIQNSTGSLNSLSITGSTFATTTAATANDALALLGTSGASVFNATVQNNTFTRAQGDLYQYTLVTGTGTMHFDSNTVTNNFSSLPAGGGDINVSSASTSSPTQSLQYSIDNNNIYSSGTGGQPPNGSVIVVAATPQGSATGTIRNNTIGTSGVTQSGGFDSILADAVKAGFHKVTITGNTIRRYKEAGIRLLGISPAASPGFTMRATVKGNSILEPDSVAFAGIDAEVGADPSDVGTMCLDLGGTAAEKNNVVAGDPNNFNDINLIQQFATSMNLPGYGGSPTDDAAVESFVAGRNDGNGTPTVFAGHDTTTSDGNPAGSGFTGAGTDCG